MKIANFNRLKKYMQMTISGSDGEALLALRKANELLAAEGVDWDRVLDRMVRLEVEHAAAYEPGERTEDQLVDEAFAAVEASGPRGSFADFVADLKEQWDRRRSLSEKQRSAILRAAERCR